MKDWHSNPAPHRRLHTGDRGEDVQRFQKALEQRSGLPVPNNGIVDSPTLEVKRQVFWDLGLPSRDYPITIGAQGNVRWPWTRTPAARHRAKIRADNINPARDGAKKTVEKIVAIAQAEHSELYVGSDFRPGDPMDHGGNNFERAARDIGFPGVNLLEGPPHSDLDDAIVAIGEALDRGYQRKETVIDTWHVDHDGNEVAKGPGTWRLQIIWRTEKYGGHMGHIHAGCHRD